MPKTYPNLELLAKEFLAKHDDITDGMTACASIYDALNALYDIYNQPNTNVVNKLIEVEQNLTILYIIANKMERGLDRRKDFLTEKGLEKEYQEKKLNSLII